MDCGSSENAEKTQEEDGVADGARTHDNRNHNPGLYQLSYSHHCRTSYCLSSSPGTGLLNRETRLYEQRFALPSPLFDEFDRFAQMSACFIENGHIAGGETAAIREHATPATRTRFASIQTKRVPRNAAEECSARHFLTRIVNQTRLSVLTRQHRCLGAVKAGINTCEHIRVVISLAPEHHAIDMFQMLFHFFERLDATIDRYLQMRKIALQLIRIFILERRNFAIFLRAQAL